MDSSIAIDTQLTMALNAHRIAATRAGLTTLADRVDRLHRLEAVLSENLDAFCHAMDMDFAGRPALQSRMELFAALESVRTSRKQVAQWMRPLRRPVPFLMRLIGVKAEVFYQPLGVIGVVAPWNFPLVLSIGPLAGIFAAGNRAMLKPSELCPHTSALLKEKLDAKFSADELTTWLGGSEVGAAFARQPFDHLLFTGAPSVAKHVMRAAAENLVPVTLELGGKCPVVIGPEADWKLAIDRVMWGKIQNAGQICLAPDYVFVPRDKVESFVQSAREQIATWYPSVKDNENYCSIISERHYQRLTGYIEQARSEGVRVEVLDPQGADFSDQTGRRIPPTLIVQPPPHLGIAQDETFGPILSVYGYSDLDEVIDFINARPRPLALYYFGEKSETVRALKERTTSGGITINDIANHAAVESLPLGGVGNSGMGCYHGEWGFRTFSHSKAILTQRRISLARMLNPPYSDKQKKMLDRMIGKPKKSN